MRATLEQLKAMSNFQLLDHWCRNRFPFDQARCGACLTMHVGMTYCQKPNEHGNLHMALTCFGLQAGTFNAAAARPYLEELFAIRLYFDSLYAPEPSELTSPQPEIEQQVETVR